MSALTLFPLLVGFLLREDSSFKPVPAGEIQHQLEVQEGQINRYLDRQIRAAEAGRASLWQRDFSSEEAYLRSVAPWRKRLADWLGGMNYPSANLQPHEERLPDTPAFTAWRVWLTAFEDVQVYGILLVPKGAAAGPRPAVIAIHGMGGSPEAVCGLSAAEDYHRRFGARLAE